MNRRALLALTGTTLTGLAGCSRTREYGAGGASLEAASEQPSSQGASSETKRVTPNSVATGPDSDACQYDQITPTEYPEVPTTFTEERVVEFVKRFERARVIDQHTGDHASLTVRVTTESVNRADDGWLVQLGGGFSAEGCSGGVTYVSDGIISAYYFVNETAVYREVAGPNTAVDPQANGTKVA